MISLPITAEEVRSGALTEAHLAAAVAALDEDGFVVLENVVSLDHIRTLRERTLADLDALLARPDSPYNWNAGNVQQDPPPFPPYLFRDVLLNDLVVQVTQAVLGQGVKNYFYSGNTALPGEDRQPVHADTGQLWPDLPVATPAFQLVVNVPLVDVSAENGGTEIWPGSHKDTTVSVRGDIKVSAEALERRRAEAPPIQPTVPQGGALIRDIRLWHAGMPNRTDAPRPMVAMIHAARWMETGTPLRFPVGTEAFFRDSPLTTCARFVDGPIDHIAAPQAYEYAAGTK